MSAFQVILNTIEIKALPLIFYSAHCSSSVQEPTSRCNPHNSNIIFHISFEYLHPKKRWSLIFSSFKQRLQVPLTFTPYEASLSIVGSLLSIAIKEINICLGIDIELQKSLCHETLFYFCLISYHTVTT